MQRFPLRRVPAPCSWLRMRAFPAEASGKRSFAPPLPALLANGGRGGPACHGRLRAEALSRSGPLPAQPRCRRHGHRARPGKRRAAGQRGGARAEGGSAAAAGARRGTGPEVASATFGPGLAWPRAGAETGRVPPPVTVWLPGTWTGPPCPALPEGLRAGPGGGTRRLRAQRRRGKPRR